nr:uncharacterized protein LOC127292205 [Lolium perenne]
MPASGASGGAAPSDAASSEAASYPQPATTTALLDADGSAQRRSRGGGRTHFVDARMDAAEAPGLDGPYVEASSLQVVQQHKATADQQVCHERGHYAAAHAADGASSLDVPNVGAGLHAVQQHCAAAGHHVLSPDAASPDFNGSSTLDTAASKGGPAPSTPPSKVTPSSCRPSPLTPSRRSTRHGVGADGFAVTDEDSLTKAMRRKAASNLDTSGNLPVYGLAPFMVVASAIGGPRPLYGGVYTVGEFGQGVYYPTWVAA